MSHATNRFLVLFPDALESFVGATDPEIVFRSWWQAHGSITLSLGSSAINWCYSVFSVARVNGVVGAMTKQGLAVRFFPMASDQWYGALLHVAKVSEALERSDQDFKFGNITPMDRDCCAQFHLLRNGRMPVRTQTTNPDVLKLLAAL